MGYYSDYTITKLDKNGCSGIISEKEFNALSEIVGFNISSNEIYESKWYSIKNDMKKFSKLFPNFTWIIDQEGEDRDDYRKYIFKDGKYKELIAEVKVIFPDENSINWK